MYFREKCMEMLCNMKPLIMIDKTLRNECPLSKYGG